MKTKNFFNIKKLEDKINIGFFTKKGGYSNGKYKLLNCNLSGNNSKYNVNKNIKNCLNALNIKNKKLKLIKQIHSNKIKIVNQNNFKTLFSGDGLVTNDKDIALGVLTADCMPIFLFDKHKKYICCLHSGWKGALKNIVNKSIIFFNKNKIKNNDLIAVMGPCISYTRFEVDKDFKEAFIKKNIKYKKFFKSKNNYKDLFDMRGLIKLQFCEMGVTNLYNINRDTYSNSKLFFSYRRSTHSKNGETGRMINIISFKD
tara:strand:- start:928 stop:1698 length:771 start_codon:yes stop_codon:yes gene_type:complete